MPPLQKHLSFKLLDCTYLYDTSYLLYKECFEYNAARLWSHEEYVALLAHPYTQGYAAYYNNKQCAFIILSIIADECEILSIGTATKYQKRGYGTQLLAHITDKLSTQKINRIILEVDEANDKAQAFYIKQRFKHISTRTAYYQNGNNAFIFQKKL